MSEFQIKQSEKGIAHSSLIAVLAAALLVGRHWLSASIGEPRPTIESLDVQEIALQEVEVPDRYLGGQFERQSITDDFSTGDILGVSATGSVDVTWLSAPAENGAVQKLVPTESSEISANASVQAAELEAQKLSQFTKSKQRQLWSLPDELIAIGLAAFIMIGMVAVLSDMLKWSETSITDSRITSIKSEAPSTRWPLLKIALGQFLVMAIAVAMILLAVWRFFDRPQQAVCHDCHQQVNKTTTSLIRNTKQQQKLDADMFPGALHATPSHDDFLESFLAALMMLGVAAMLADMYKKAAKEHLQRPSTDLKQPEGQHRDRLQRPSPSAPKLEGAPSMSSWGVLLALCAVLCIALAALAVVLMLARTFSHGIDDDTSLPVIKPLTNQTLSTDNLLMASDGFKLRPATHEEPLAAALAATGMLGVAAMLSDSFVLRKGVSTAPRAAGESE